MLSFRNGLGKVPGVYEATTIAQRTPPDLAVTTVGGTGGVFKTSFWPNIASAHPTSGLATKFSTCKSMCKSTNRINPATVCALPYYRSALCVLIKY